MNLKLANKNFLTVIILNVLIFLSYGNAFNKAFLLDDYPFLLNENNVREKSFVELFTGNLVGFYRPIAFLVLKIIAFISDGNPIGYNICNIILFFVVSYLFYIVSLNLFRNWNLAFLASCLFTIHPMNNFLINYKPAGLLACYLLCMQISILFFLRFVDLGRKEFYLLSLVFFGLSLFSHEVSFMLPAYLFLIMLYLKNIPLKRNLLTCLPYIGVFLIYILIRSSMNTVRPIDTLLHIDISLGAYGTTVRQLISWYLSKLVFPKDILFIWDVRIPEMVTWFKNLIFVMSILIIIYFALVKWRGKNQGFALAMFAAGFLPVGVAGFVYSHLNHTAIIEAHWLSFASIGFFILVSQFLLFFQKILNYKVWIILVFLIFGILIINTRKSNIVWADASTYCNYWLGLNKLNGAAWDCKAQAYIQENDKGLERGQYRDCIEVANLAGAFNENDEYETARQYYLMALDMNPQCLSAWYGLGVVYQDMGDYSLAEKALKTAIEYEPNYYKAYEELINVYEKQGRFDEAQILKSMKNF